MLSPDLEFSIAQYADGTLPASEIVALERILETDADARELLAAYQATDTALKGMPGDLPGMHWDELAGSISASIARLADDQAAGAMPEGLEFSIAQYADGSLGDDGRSGVEARLAKDPSARLMLRDYEAVDAATRKLAFEIDPPPVVAGLAAMPSEAESSETDEQAEFELVQYADGSLAAERHEAVETRLASDALARFTLAEYQQLGSAMQAMRADRPAVRWDALADHLSDVVLGPVEVEETFSYRIFAAVRKPMWLAAAASVVIAATLGITLIRQHGNGGTGGTVVPGTVTLRVQVATVEIAGPELAAGQAVAEIEIGPSPSLAKAEGDGGFADVGVGDDLSSRPSRTVIASGVTVREDLPTMPF